MIEIGKVDPGTIPYIWGDIEQLLRDRGGEWLSRVDLTDVLQVVSSGGMDLWAMTEGNELKGVLFGTWEQHRFAGDYHVTWCAGYGAPKHFDKVMDKVEGYVSLMGGTSVIVGGRPGWFRFLRRRGFTPVFQMQKSVGTYLNHRSH